MPELSRRTFLGAAALGTAAVAGLTACGSPSSTSNPGGGSVSAGPGPGGYKMDLGGYTGPELTSEQITLRVMRQNWTPASDKVFDSTVAAFTKAYPNITVKQEYVPYGGLGEKLRTTFAAGSAADIAMGQSALISSYVYGEMAVPVGDYLTEEFKSGYMEYMRTAVTVDDHLYGMPSFVNTQGMSYNKEIWDKAKIETPPESDKIEDGWSLEQWFETWARLRSWMDGNGHREMFPISPSGFGDGGPGSNYQQLEQTWIRMQGSPDAPQDSDEYKVWAGLSPDGKTVQGYVNNPLAVQGAKNYQKIFTERWSPTGNQSAMMLAGQTAVSWDGFLRDPEFAWGVTPLPRGKIVSLSNASDTFIVTSQSKHPAEATALLAAFNAVPAQVDWAVGWGGVPPSEPVIAAMPAEARDSMAMRININYARASYPPPATPAWFEYTNQMNTTMRDIALGADPADALNKAAEKIDQHLAKY
nr:extracellular solute-binding protein [Propionicimonas sp.]